jgi:hypothetical protein
MTMTAASSLFIFITCFTSVFSGTAFAWGHDGHGATGILAIDQLQPEVRLELQNILGSVDDETLIEACNWPDAVRETEEWSWTYPTHYINLPKGENHYLESRDCPDQLCATQAIKKYAVILGDDQSPRIERQQAFAWVCHLTGDLHQPLHAGFAADRGGNDFEIVFENEQTNLHGFWDSTLIKNRATDWIGLLEILRVYPVVEASNNWAPEMVNQWTDESHQLVMETIYPKAPVITDDYANESWELLQQRLSTGASRLALIINSSLQSR